jgi:hypothetical protein
MDRGSVEIENRLFDACFGLELGNHPSHDRKQRDPAALLT